MPFDNVYRFRRIKWGEPTKLKVLAEDLAPHQNPYSFVLIIIAVMVVTFGIVYVASDALIHGSLHFPELM